LSGSAGVWPVDHTESIPVMKDLDYTWVWPALSRLFTEQGFLTVVCGLLFVSMTVRCYRLLRGLHPMLVPLSLLLAALVLVFHWTQTRTEPKAFTPAVDYLASVLPMPVYQGARLGAPATANPPAPGKPAAKPGAPVTPTKHS
jgi:hypothetical protein